MTFTGTSSPTDKKAEMVQGDIVWRISEAREGTFNFGLFRAIHPRLQEFHHHRKMSGNRLEGRRDHEKAKALSPYSKGRPKEFSSLAAAEEIFLMIFIKQRKPITCQTPCQIRRPKTGSALPATVHSVYAARTDGWQTYRQVTHRKLYGSCRLLGGANKT